MGSSTRVEILSVNQNGGEYGKLNLYKEECETSGVTSEGQPTLRGFYVIAEALLTQSFSFARCGNTCEKWDSGPVDRSLDTSPVFFTLRGQERNSCF